MWSECPHPTDEIRRKVNAIGVSTYKRQCLTCGAATSSFVPKTTAPVGVRDWDDALQEGTWAARREESRKRHEDAQAFAISEDAVWRAKYQAHMRSPAWAAIRQKVKQREGGWCQGCGMRAESGEAHHVDYRRMGHELLFDLRWVCHACHDRCHPEHPERK